MEHGHWHVHVAILEEVTGSIVVWLAECDFAGPQEPVCKALLEKQLEVISASDRTKTHRPSLGLSLDREKPILVAGHEGLHEVDDAGKWAWLSNIQTNHRHAGDCTEVAANPGF